MQHLLLLLPIRHENWFHELVYAMRFNGYHRIVNAILAPGMYDICQFLLLTCRECHDRLTLT